MVGGHRPRHIAALVAQLPPDCRIACAENADNRWSLTDSLLATIANALHGLIWGMGDPKKRGTAPQLIGPSWMTRGRTHSLPACVMSVGELMDELSKPRR